MFALSSRKKHLTTYSKKVPRTRYRSTFASPTSDDRQHRKRYVTLTSPVHGSSSPPFPSSISLPLSPQSNHEDDEGQRAETNLTPSKPRRRPELPPESSSAHELTMVTSPDRITSPVSSSEHDSISDEDMPVGRGARKRARRGINPQPLSTLRRSLNVRPKRLRIVGKPPTSTLSAETLGDIERGADGFDEVHLVLLTVSDSRNEKRKTHNASVKPALDILRGPHPPVDFDNSGWSIVPCQYFHDHEQKEAVGTVDAIQKVERVLIDNTHPEGDRLKSPPKSSARPSAKEVLLYAQLSSVSAPIRRRSSYGEESENNYANGFMTGEEDEFEQGMSDAEQEELGLGTVR